mmetsp:Transcript_102/g.314  ORF Transcript_102/g.314 Transcript_102/m.314 type:complete len:330 (+) Transcript_102:66-1055(+)
MSLSSLTTGRFVAGGQCLGPARRARPSLALGGTSKASHMRLACYSKAARKSSVPHLRSRRLPPCASGKGFQTPQEELKKTAATDALIDSMLAMSVEDRRLRLTQNLMDFGTDFYLRCAARSDAAASEEEKQKFVQLASECMNITDAVIREAETKMDRSEQVLRDILTAAADPDSGEFEVPLSPAAVSRMDSVMNANRDSCGEEMLAYAFAYLRKLNEDKENEVDGMALIIQKVLQLFCKLTLATPEDPDAADRKPEERILDSVLRSDVSLWQEALSKRQELGASKESLVQALRARMEAVVLGDPSGSYTQKVHAEYLQEVEAYINKIQE